MLNLHLICFLVIIGLNAVNAGSPTNSTNRKTNGIVKKQFIDYGAGGGGAEGESFMSNDASTFTRQQQTSQEGEGISQTASSFQLEEDPAAVESVDGARESASSFGGDGNQLGAILNSANNEGGGIGMLGEVGLSKEGDGAGIFGQDGDQRNTVESSNSQREGLSSTISSLINQDTSDLEDVGQQSDSNQQLETQGAGNLEEREAGNSYSSLSGMTNEAFGGSQGGNTAEDTTASLSASPSVVNGAAGSNDGEDIMSAFNDQDPFGKKFESSVNLGDMTSTAFASSPSAPELSALEEGNLKEGGASTSIGGSTSEIDKLLHSGYSLGLPSSGETSNINGGESMNSGAVAAGKNEHHIGDTKGGIGTKIENVQDLLSKELGQLDSADEKLEKMLEGGINTDSSSFNADGMDQMGAATPNSMTADGVQGMGGAGLGTAGEWGGDAFGMQGMQSANQYPDSPSLTNINEATLNPQQQASGVTPGASHPTAATGSTGGHALPTQIQHTVVHQHASDKPGTSKIGGNNLSMAASNNAAKVQQQQSDSHKSKLKMLRERLRLLDTKITQLEDEQSKKSTSTSSDEKNPRKIKSNAIKRLLIKNLRLAAMIATKEIQLEEAKARSLSNTSKRKEDNLKVNENDVSDVKHMDKDFLNESKPLTELSRKAEEEVNHLTKNADSASSKASILHKNKPSVTMVTNSTKSTNATTTTTTVDGSANVKLLTNSKTSPTRDIEHVIKNIKNNATLSTNNNIRINETLAILDQSGASITGFKTKENLATSNSSTVDAEKKSGGLQNKNEQKTVAIPAAKKTTSLPQQQLFSKTTAAAVGDEGMATLFTQMKAKSATAASAKRRSMLLHKNSKMQLIKRMKTRLPIRKKD